jgi:chitosanase
MNATTKKKIISIVNCFEMGTSHIQYDQITILNDGPNKVKQFTGSFGVTEAYNLKTLIELYIQKKGKFSKEFEKYLPNMGKKFILADDKSFHTLWKKAAREDVLMREAQDETYENIYYKPAEQWSIDAEFIYPLSYLIVFDSMLQSGSIMKFLRNKFPEKLPSNGGDEKAWIKAYLTVRNDWLSNHSNKAVRNSSYRTRDLLRIIHDNDWYLEKPVKANDIIVD